MSDRHWNYRIVKRGDHYGLCEVHYEDGEPSLRGDPILGWLESVDDLRGDLTMAMRAFRDDTLDDFVEEAPDE